MLFISSAYFFCLFQTGQFLWRERLLVHTWKERKSKCLKRQAETVGLE